VKSPTTNMPIEKVRTNVMVLLGLLADIDVTMCKNFIIGCRSLWITRLQCAGNPSDSMEGGVLDTIPLCFPGTVVREEKDEEPVLHNMNCAGRMHADVPVVLLSIHSSGTPRLTSVNAPAACSDASGMVIDYRFSFVGFRCD
jgi:hypothetical protein